MTRIVAYTAVYGGFDDERVQPIEVRRITERQRPSSLRPRMAAKWWKVFPDLACPDADVTIWLDGSMDVLRPDLADLCLRALGDADAIFVRHPWRDDIYTEAIVSSTMPKYAGEPLDLQVAHYRWRGHPEHWGLMHAGMLVRRNTDAVRALSLAWWREIEAWSDQDQLSLPFLLRTNPELDYRWFGRSPLDVLPGDAGWVHWGSHARSEALA